MTYEEAEIESFKTRWELEECESSQPKCWCACIKTNPEITYEEHNVDYPIPYYVCGSGALTRETAKYIVEIHNLSIVQKKLAETQEQDKKDKDIYGYYAD